MIKDVMVSLDGSEADAARLDAGIKLAELFQAQIIGLLINVLPLPVAYDASAEDSGVLINTARAAGEPVEVDLARRLSQLPQPFQLRCFDVLGDTASIVATRQARTADAFVALRPNGTPEVSDDIVKEVLFGAGHHLLLVPRGADSVRFRHIVVAWNGTRESARALSEAIPYLEQADQISVVVITDYPDAAEERLLGTEAISYLSHHGISAELRYVENGRGDAGLVLLGVAQSVEADVIVLGGSGHSRFREWVFGGVTQKLLHGSPLPLLIAH